MTKMKTPQEKSTDILNEYLIELDNRVKDLEINNFQMYSNNQRLLVYIESIIELLIDSEISTEEDMKERFDRVMKEYDERISELIKKKKEDPEKEEKYASMLNSDTYSNS